MTLFKFLIVILATCGSIYTLPTKSLPYSESLKEVKATEKIFTDVILSMAENIPHLNDYRRHYSEIIHSIYHIATIMAYNCSVTDREGLYDKLLEEGVTEAITDVTHVVEVTKQFLDDLNAFTDAIQKLINSECGNDTTERDCDKIIHNLVLNEPEKYAKEASLLLSAGESAKAFNSNSDKFNKISTELEAHKYVLTQPIELNVVVTAFTKFIPILYPDDSPCIKYV